MSYVTWRFDHTPFVNNAWATASTTQITSFFSPAVTVSLGDDSKDSFSLQTINFADRQTNRFNANDKITIYRTLNSATVNTVTDVLMNGTLKDVPVEETGTNLTLRLEGNNYSDAVLGALVFIEVVNKSIPDAIIQGLARVQTDNTNFGVTWNYTSSATVMSNGASFPTVSDRFLNKPLKDVVKKYSQAQYTTDGTYYWYVDNTNKLVWNKGSVSSSSTFNQTTDVHKGIKIKKDIKGVRNWFVMRGGYLPSGGQIQTRYVDRVSVSKYGNKYQFVVSEKNKAENLVALDVVATYGALTSATTKYPNLNSNYTTVWNYATASSSYEVVAGITCTNGTPVTITGGSLVVRQQNYNAVVKQHIINLLVKEAQRYAEDTAFGKLQAEVSFAAGTKDWRLGDKIQCTIPEVQASPIELRVNEIQYATEMDIYTLKQDVGTL